MKTDEVVIKPSDIHGKGVFASRDFKMGEAVLLWDRSDIISAEEFKKLADDEKRYVCFEDGLYVRMQEPERYVNHSCDSNTIVKQFSDIAIRDIKKGEEITSNYNKDSSVIVKFRCGCAKCLCVKDKHFV
jgi:SET domain-containing protein